LAKAAAIPFFDEADIRRDFLDFFASGGLRDEVLPNAEPDLTGRRSLEMVEPERSRPFIWTGAETTDAASSGTDMLLPVRLPFRLGNRGRGSGSSS
jgi:hypothetical protein